jgi:hypothetical protein
MIGTRETFEILTPQDLRDMPDPPTRPGMRPGTPIRGALTWATLCKLEPRLVDLAKEIGAIDLPRRHAVASWYNRFKPQLCGLVGWEADDLYEDDPLAECESFDLAHRHLYKLLMIRSRARQQFTRKATRRRFSPRTADAD